MRTFSTFLERYIPNAKPAEPRCAGGMVERRENVKEKLEIAINKILDNIAELAKTATPGGTAQIKELSEAANMLIDQWQCIK